MGKALGVPGQDDVKSGTFVFIVFRPDSTVVIQYDLFGDGQPEPCTAKRCLCFAALPEFIKNKRKFLLRNAGASI